MNRRPSRAGIGVSVDSAAGRSRPHNPEHGPTGVRDGTPASGRAPLARDPTVEIQAHLPDDRFVPVRASELAAVMAADASTFGPDAPMIPAVASAIGDVIEQEAGEFERLIADSYAAFNPDRDTLPIGAPSAARTPEAYASILSRLDYLLAKANFQKLTEVQIEAVVRIANVRRVRVRLNPELIDHLSIWVRGRARSKRTVRDWRHPIHGCVQEFEVFRRLAVVARLRDDPNVILKLFKEIPAADVEALLPHAEVRMSWLDRIKAFGSGAGAAGSLAAKLLKFVAGALYLSRILWVILIGGVVLAFRTFFGYRSARIHRDWRRTRHLYFQNLDNNAGVIHSLVAMVAQEEAKEALLLYAFCRADERSAAGALRAAAAAGSAMPGAMDAPQGRADVDGRVEAYLRERFGTAVNFDHQDASATLGRLDLWDPTAGIGRVIAPHDAVDRLRAHWRARRTLHFHTQASAGTGPA